MIPQTYRREFEPYASDETPIEYLLALAYHESANDPKATPPAWTNSSAIGLFQILDSTREDHNRDTGKNYPRVAMEDPATACEVAVWLLKKIQRAYRESAPRIFSLPYSEAWIDLGYVRLVTLGYVAGWSPTQGVAYLCSKLEMEGVDFNSITTAQVISKAGELFPRSTIYVSSALKDASGRGPYMSDPALLSHVISIGASYFDSLPSTPSTAVLKRRSYVTGEGVVWGIVALFAGMFAAARWKK